MLWVLLQHLSLQFENLYAECHQNPSALAHPTLSELVNRLCFLRAVHPRHRLGGNQGRDTPTEADSSYGTCSRPRAQPKIAALATMNMTTPDAACRVGASRTEFGHAHSVLPGGYRDCALPYFPHHHPASRYFHFGIHDVVAYAVWSGVMVAPR